jgi:hypothetical protein
MTLLMGWDEARRNSSQKYFGVEHIYLAWMLRLSWF